MTPVLILLGLVALNAFFAASEMAFISLNDNKINVMAEDGHPKAIVLARLLSEPTKFLSTIQIGITLAGFLASAFASDSFADPLVQWIAPNIPWLSAGTLRSLVMVIITMILSLVSLVFGELVPKQIGRASCRVRV